jgi:hypothetical protein
MSTSTAPTVYVAIPITPPKQDTSSERLHPMAFLMSAPVQSRIKRKLEVLEDVEFKDDLKEARFRQSIKSTDRSVKDYVERAEKKKLHILISMNVT